MIKNMERTKFFVKAETSFSDKGCQTALLRMFYGFLRSVTYCAVI